MSRSKGSLLGPRSATTQDLDPEDDHSQNQQDPSGDEDDASELEDAFDGREHYQDVGKGRLRQPDQPQLGDLYSGTVVSRNALDLEAESDNENDPFAPVDDDEKDPFPVAADDDGVTSSIGQEDEEDEEISGSNDEEHNDDEYASTSPGGDLTAYSGEDSGSSSGMSDEGGRNLPQSQTTAINRADKINQATTRNGKVVESGSTAAGIPESYRTAAANDAKKGQAIQTQQKAHERLLDARIKLQKGLTASEHIVEPTDQETGLVEAIRKAEAAASALLSTIESIRTNIRIGRGNTTSRGSSKRKRTSMDEPGISFRTLWHSSLELEKDAVPERLAIIERWAKSTRSSFPSTTGGKADQLQSEVDRLTADTEAASPLDYSDDQFYQSLLRDLISSRSRNASVGAMEPLLPSKLHVSGSAKKSVDTKASKGRKIRYDVHEKLQNFMAAEDRTTWTESARQEFFASLFGQRLLDVDDELITIENEQDGERSSEHAALRLFRER